MKYTTVFKSLVSKIKPKSITAKNLDNLRYSASRRFALRDKSLVIPHDAIYCMSQSDTADWLNTLLKMNAIAGNPVHIEGNIRDVTTQQWLTLEHQLCVQLIKQCGDGAVETDIRGSRVPKQFLSAAGRQHFFGSIAFDREEASLKLGLTALALVMSNGYLIDSGNLPYLPLSCFSFSLLLGCLVADMASRLPLYWDKQGVKKWTQQVSSTWEEVFAMTTEADVFLLTWLQEIILQTEEVSKLPRFTKLDPKEAALLLANLIIEPKRDAQSALYAPSGNQAPMMLSGVDMSGFANTENYATQRVATPEPEREHTSG